MKNMTLLNTITAVASMFAMFWSSPAFGSGIKSGIFKAVANDDLDQVASLLKDNPDLVFCKGPIISGLGGYTPLHVAEQYERKDMVDMLLTNKADINATNNVGQTPLHWSANEGHRDMADLLLAHKANVNAKDIQGLTPLDYAAEEGHKDVAELLRQHGGSNTLFQVELPDIAGKLSTQKYNISPDTFFSNLKHLMTPNDGESDTKLLRRFLKERNIEARLFLNDKLGLLLVGVATPEEQEEVKKLVVQIASAK